MSSRLRAIVLAALGVACTQRAAVTSPAPAPGTSSAATSPSTGPGVLEAESVASSSAAPPGAACSSDGDCVPARCCHSRECVTKAEAPDCTGRVCTTDCRGGTLDCGGTCGCEAGKCVAHVRRP